MQEVLQFVLRHEVAEHGMPGSGLQNQQVAKLPIYVRVRGQGKLDNLASLLNPDPCFQT